MSKSYIAFALILGCIVFVIECAPSPKSEIDLKLNDPSVFEPKKPLDDSKVSISKDAHSTRDVPKPIVYNASLFRKMMRKIAERNRKEKLHKNLVNLVRKIERNRLNGLHKRASNLIEINAKNWKYVRARPSSELQKVHSRKNARWNNRVNTLKGRHPELFYSPKFGKKTTEKTVINLGKVEHRNKRSLKLADSQMDALNSILQNQEAADQDEDEEITDYSDENVYSGRGASSQREEQQLLREQEQKEQMSFINKDEYRDYELDTTDTDQFNEEDDLLRRYYGHSVRQAAYEDYDSFSDLMHLAAAQSRRDPRYMKQLHYGFFNDDTTFNDDKVDDPMNYDTDYFD